MSATPTSNKNFIKVVGITTFVAGIIFLLAGFGTWMMVSSQLKAENITVSSDAKWFADKQVAGLFTAYSQADIINTHALKGSNGKTYADLGAEMAKIDDKESAEYKELATQRASVMNGSFLRASLFTSVLAFGVSALVMGLGVVLALAGLAIRRLAQIADARTDLKMKELLA